MGDRVLLGIYILACIVSGVTLFLATTAGSGAFEGFVKLGVGVAVYFIGRDISRYRSRA